ncbi:hypothetical protein [Pseudonocardia phyllosphaerae]|uniref:hypothetical protein n=1 Tax=Pseudonocardia phyllosphaerae TaxID=3390502 RepID=UPI0039790B7C
MNGTHAPPRATPSGGSGTSALVLGALGLLLVLAAIGLAAMHGLVVTGFVLAAAGAGLALAGLVVGILAVRPAARPSRAALSGAGLSVAGLAAGLVWVAAFVVSTLAVPAAHDPGAGSGRTVCAAAYCAPGR